MNWVVVVKVDSTLLIATITVFKATVFQGAVTALGYVECSVFKGRSLVMDFVVVD